MKYKCRSIPLTKLFVTNKGFLKPLCTNCQTIDCENDIEIQKVSIMGITTEYRLLTKKDGSYIVSSCEGFIDDKK